MSNSIQHVLLTGHIGKIHQFESTSTTRVIAFSLAIKSSEKNGDSFTEQTTWLECKAFGKTAEYVISKGIGAYVAVTGDKLGLRTYESQQSNGAVITLTVSTVRVQPSMFKDTSVSQVKKPVPVNEPVLDDTFDEQVPF